MSDYDHIRDALPKSQDERRVRRMWRRIEAKRAPNASRIARPLRALVFVVASIAGTVAAYRAHTRPPLGIAGLEHVPPSLAADGLGRRIALTDGSVIALGAGARVDVITRTTERFELALRRGKADFDVASGGAPAWQVDVAGIAITFEDTAFAVERGAEEVVFQVRRGFIVLRGDHLPDRVVRLTAGAVYRVRVGPAALGARAEVAPTTTPTPPTSVVREPDIEELIDEPALARDTRPSPIAASDGAATWQSSFADGQYTVAYEALGSAGLAREANRVDRVEDLFALADVARLSGHPRDAMYPLTRIVEQYPADPRAGMASYTIGQLELDRLGRPREAADAYARALTLGLPRSMRELATARRVEALGRAGAPDVAAAVDAYLASYPEGRYRTEVARWAAP
jgi:transmembrane sensor